MARTPSQMVDLGTKACNFDLVDTVSGQNLSLDDLKSDKGTLIMFICNHCPFVKHIQKELVNLAQQYQPKGINFIAISSNDVSNYPEDAPELMAEEAKRLGFTFPYLYDETQEVAKNYEAACTPDFFLYDGHLNLVYRGQLDDSRPDNGIPVTGHDLRAALDCLLSNKPISAHQKPSIGCNIKWKV